jgi:perosamine synthetase
MPAAGTIPLCVPEIVGNAWEYVKECLDTNWVSSVGPFVTRFEESVATYVGARHGIATSSGTAAIHTALMVAGVQPDDEVLVSALTFIAPANAVRYCGAWPVFIDAEPNFWQMDAQRVVDFLETQCRYADGQLFNKTTGRRVKAILPVHVLGHPVDIDPILEVAAKYGLPVIEDATESLGATYKDRSVGHLGAISCFSFNGNKLITTGGGGMVVTDNDEWATRAKYLTTQAKDDAIEYVHHTVGFNYRLTNVQAALGCAQVEVLPTFIEKKRSIAAGYREQLADLPGLTLMPEAPWARPVFWLYTVLIDESKFGMDSRRLMRELAKRGVQARPLWQPLHRSQAFAGAEVIGGEVADKLNQNALSLPSSVGLTDSELESVAEAISASHG